MVSTATILFVVFSLFVSLILPVLLLILFAARNKKQGLVSAWLLGAAGFFVTQILIRLPILTALQSQSWFLAFARNHLFLYAFGLAFTAGLFELAGRFAVAKCLRKNLTYKRSLAAGLGHGGIEAMILIGMTYINNLIYIAMINSGAFDMVLAQAGCRRLLRDPDSDPAAHTDRSAEPELVPCLCPESSVSLCLWSCFHGGSV